MLLQNNNRHNRLGGNIKSIPSEADGNPFTLNDGSVEWVDPLQSEIRFLTPWKKKQFFQTFMEYNLTSSHPKINQTTKKYIHIM